MGLHTPHQLITLRPNTPLATDPTSKSVRVIPKPQYVTACTMPLITIEALVQLAFRVLNVNPSTHKLHYIYNYVRVLFGARLSLTSCRF